MDALQKKYSKQLGFFPRAQMEGYVRAGNVLIAEERHEGTEALRHEGEYEGGVSSYSVPTCLSASVPVPLGYVAFRDRYLKRDELGVIYQLCVSPAGQRKLVGARLIQEVFSRSPYGCKLYCCWCAQEIAANRFWEALGFVPLAFRAGSEKKSRVHIFWQKRLRDGDATPWWYPSETGGGAIKENRLVLPIPPGTHWSDAKPTVLPGKSDEAMKRLSDEGEGRKARSQVPSVASSPARSVASSSSLHRPMFATPKEAKPIRSKPAERVARRNDPALVARARELRDRWLEEVNAGESPFVALGKYDVTRIEGARGESPELIDAELIDAELIDAEVIEAQSTKLLAA